IDACLSPGEVPLQDRAEQALLARVVGREQMATQLQGVSQRARHRRAREDLTGDLDGAAKYRSQLLVLLEQVSACLAWVHLHLPTSLPSKHHASAARAVGARNRAVLASKPFAHRTRCA